MSKNTQANPSSQVPLPPHGGGKTEKSVTFFEKNKKVKKTVPGRFKMVSNNLGHVFRPKKNISKFWLKSIGGTL